MSDGAKALSMWRNFGRTKPETPGSMGVRVKRRPLRKRSVDDPCRGAVARGGL
jgi:hypothetical protein